MAGGNEMRHDRVPKCVHTESASNIILKNIKGEYSYVPLSYTILYWLTLFI